jgi:hypothetical protein
MPRKKKEVFKLNSDSFVKLREDDPKYLSPEERSITPISERTINFDIPMNLELSERQEYYGQSLVKYEWREPIGVSGLKWSNGVLYLEQSPHLYPFIARGRRGEPGEYQTLYRSSPWIQEKIRNLIVPISTAPWALSFPETEDPEAQQQYDFQKQVFENWIENTEYNLSDYIESTLRTALVCGFSLNEIVWYEEDELPSLPKERLPESIDEWILNPKRWMGVVQSSYRNDASGSNQRYQTVIPAEKLVKTTFEPTSEEDYEGRSLLRAVWRPLNMLLDLLAWQMGCLEVNSHGTIVIQSQGPESPTLSQEVRNELEHHLLSFKGSHVPYVLLPSGWEYNLVSAQQSISDLSSQIQNLERIVNIGLSNTNGSIGANGSGGSYALKDISSKDARDLLDQLALMMVKHFKQLFHKLLKFQFPDHKKIHIAKINYAQVENRDNKEYLEQVKTFTEIAPKLSIQNRRILAQMLDLIVDEDSP